MADKERMRTTHRLEAGSPDGRPVSLLTAKAYPLAAVRKYGVIFTV